MANLIDDIKSVLPTLLSRVLLGITMSLTGLIYYLDPSLIASLLPKVENFGLFLKFLLMTIMLLMGVCAISLSVAWHYYKVDKQKPHTIFHNNILWLLTDQDPYCPHCFDFEQKLIHMKESKIVKLISNSPNWVPALSCTHCPYETEYAKHP